MTTWEIQPSKLKGTLHIPPSKSQSMRALTFALLAKGKSVLSHLLPSPEMLHTCRLLGASVEEFPDRVEVIGLNGQLNGASDVINAGNSGIILRFIGALGALSPQPLVITGDHSIRHNRPVLPLLEGLTQLGARAFSLNGTGKAPIFVQGPLHGGHATISGEDSQPVSALLIASSFAPAPVELFVTNPGELPWVQLTLDWLDRLELPYQNEGGAYYSLPGNGSIEGFAYTVPGDFSSAAFPLAAALLTNSEVTLQNLDFRDPQGDKQLISYLQQMGAHIEVTENALHIKKGSALHGAKLDLNTCIDTLPILAVIACFAEGETVLSGAKIARRKECDRIAAITKELKKMGAHIEEHPDGVTIKHSPLKGGIVESYNDHRMALALSVAGLAAREKTHVHSVECVDKTFPHFQAHMQALGAHIV